MSNEARAAEAADQKTATVTFRGIEFEVPRTYDDWPIQFIQALDQGASRGKYLPLLLGEATWARLVKLNLKGSDLIELDQEVAVALGFKNPGE